MKSYFFNAFSAEKKARGRSKDRFLLSTNTHSFLHFLADNPVEVEASTRGQRQDSLVSQLGVALTGDHPQGRAQPDQRDGHRLGAGDDHGQLERKELELLLVQPDPGILRHDEVLDELVNVEQEISAN